MPKGLLLFPPNLTMNWPPLSAETSNQLARVLEEAVKSKPKDLLEHVASKLQARSGWDMRMFEAHFEECRKQPRTYKLEDKCPPEQDPIVWVPTRYSDDTILESLRSVSGELMKRILAEGHVIAMNAAGGDFLECAEIAFPELSYLSPGSEGRMQAELMLRTVSVVVAEEEIDVRSDFFRERNPDINGPLVDWARQRLRTGLRKSAELLDAMVVCMLMRVVSTSSRGFRERYEGTGAKKDGKQQTSEEMLVQVMRKAPLALPSFRRLPPHLQSLVEAVRLAAFPFQELLTTEALPAHLAAVKDEMGPYDSGITFLLSTVLVEQIVAAGAGTLVDVQLRSVELVKLGAQAVAAVEKYNAVKSYELFLKKRAEQVEVRVQRDDYLQRACVRISCMALLREREDWDAVQKAVNELPENEKEVLKRELGMKDGTGTGAAVVDSSQKQLTGPTFAMTGCSRYLIAAQLNRAANIWPGPAVKVLCRVLEDGARSYSQSKERMLKMNFEGLADFAQNYNGISFDDLFFLLEENSASGVITVRVTG